MQGSALPLNYYDGHSAQAQAARLLWQGDAVLIETDAGQSHRVLVRDVQWPERTRHGVRVAHLPGGAMVRAHDAAHWDAWVAAHGRRDTLTVRLQQSWRGVVACLVGLVVVVGALWQWGIPVAAQVAAPWVPARVQQELGALALEQIERQWLAPSELPEAEQQRLRQAFAQALTNLPADAVPPHQLLFRASTIGPNAFALPGGTMVLTDEMVALLDNDADAITGVLGHELGHVRERHGLRSLIQLTLAGVLSDVVLGNFSGWLAVVPVWLAQASYSREAEREADAVAVEVLRATGISPLVMVDMFEKLAAYQETQQEEEQQEEEQQEASAPKATEPDASASQEEGGLGVALGIALASHPSDEDRIRFFREAAAP